MQLRPRQPKLELARLGWRNMLPPDYSVAVGMYGYL